MYPLLESIIQNIVTAMKTLRVPMIHASLPPLPGNHSSFYRLHSFPFFRMSYSWTRSLRPFHIGICHLGTCSEALLTGRPSVALSLGAQCGDHCFCVAVTTIRFHGTLQIIGIFSSQDAQTLTAGARSLFSCFARCSFGGDGAGSMNVFPLP